MSDILYWVIAIVLGYLLSRHMGDGFSGEKNIPMCTASKIGGIDGANLSFSGGKGSNNKNACNLDFWTGSCQNDDGSYRCYRTQ